MKSIFTQQRAAQFRGPSTSDEYNKRIEENYKDLVHLANRARISEVELDELYRRTAKDGLSFARVLSDLEDRVADLENDKKRFTFYSQEQMDFETFDDTQFAVPVEDRLTFDQQHGILTAPLVESSSLSKLFYTNTEGREVVPSTLEMRVIGDSDTADDSSAFIDTSEPEYALYRRPGLIWERNVVAETANNDGARLTLYVKAPTDLFTTANSNNIVIHPFPYFGTTIEEIAYTLRPDPVLRDTDGYVQFNEPGHYAGENEAKGWVIPGGWGGAESGNDAAVQTGPRSYIFSPKPITALRVTLHQPNHYQEAGKYVYTYGLSFFDMRYNKYLNEGRAMIRVDAPPGETISDIVDVQPQIWNTHPAELYNVFEYRVLWESAPGTGTFDTVPVANSPQAWLEVTLKNAPGWSPALSGLIVDYV